jgi:sugar phosphate isomerase/epimerase
MFEAAELGLALLREDLADRAAFSAFNDHVGVDERDAELVCRRAGELTVALEFMPYSGVPDLRTAWEVIASANAPNAGLLVDAWHWARAGTVRDDLRPISAGRIVAIQLSDVAEHSVPVPREESLHHRLPPGRGHGDVVGMLRALRRHGADPAVVAVEMMSDELLSRGAQAVAATCFRASREVLAVAGAP